MATQAEIQQYLAQFGGNYTPEVMAQIGAAAQQYGVSPAQLAAASGFSVDQVNAGLLSGAVPQPAPVAQAANAPVPVAAPTPAAATAAGNSIYGPDVTVLTYRIPSDAGGMSENMPDSIVARAQAIVNAGGKVAIVPSGAGAAANTLSPDRVSQIVANMSATGKPANVDSFMQSGLEVGQFHPAQSLGSHLGSFVKNWGPAVAGVLAAGYGLNALSGAGGGAAAGGGAGWTGTVSPEFAASMMGEAVPTAGGFLSASELAALGAGGAGAAGAGAATAGGYSALPATGMVGTGGLSAADAAMMGVGGTGAAGVGGAVGGGAATTGGLFGTGITGMQAAQTGLGLLGSSLTGSSAADAAKTSADAQIRAAQIAADAAKFRPVGVTTRFGGSNFGYDAQGNLVSAGYTMSPDARAAQDRLVALAGQGLTQLEGVGATTAPMGQAAQTLFGLGQGYLSTTPQQQAAKYMADQQALLSTSRERQLAQLQNTLQQQGRLGLATGATGLMGAANPELEAFYNAQRQQDLGLAAQATQGGMDYARFGAGLVGTGGDLLNSMYGTQSAAYDPYQTALGGAVQLEGLGQQSMNLGTAIGAQTSTASANAGELMARGMIGAANTMQPANAYSPWGALLSGAGSALGQYGQPQQQYKFDPFTGKAL